MSFTFTDLFCGAGGSISGMVEAGAELVLGANHSAKAIETVSTNFNTADFLCTDINNYDMRCLPKTQVLWASVICTQMSPAGGRKKHKGQGILELEMEGHVRNEDYERTRACALDVIRATEVHRYDAVIVENVVEFATTWELYDWWVTGMCLLKPGYNVQVLNVSAAHVYGEGNDPAPQWRDRIFIVFTKKGIPLPDLEVRPPSWCWGCEDVVEARQAWKKAEGRRIGKYGQQYIYRCPTCGAEAEPFVLPAVAALDLDDLGTRIGDRERPLADNTMARIEWGIRTFWAPIVAQVAGNTFERPASGYRRAVPAEGSPLTTRQGTGCDALVNPIMVNGQSGGVERRVTPTDGAPLGAIQAQGRGHHQLLCPPLTIKNNNGGAGEAHHRAHPASDPLGSLTASPTQALLTNSANDDNRTRPAGAGPLPTATGKIGYGLVHPPLVVPRRTGGRARPADGGLLPAATSSGSVDLVQPLVGTSRNHGEAVPADGAPLTTVTGQGRHHEMIAPPLYVKNHGGWAQPSDCTRSAAGEPLGTLMTKVSMGLVVPYRRGRTTAAAGEPLHTLATRDGEALLTPPSGLAGSELDTWVHEAALNSWYRMLGWREHANGQRFDPAYEFTGNKGQNTLMAGNAVAVNVAHHVGHQVALVLA
jgi:DNA (cytosine-5)-methyltransferase 1